MIKELEERKRNASSLLQSLSYIVTIKDNALPKEKKTHTKVTDIEYIFITY
jgi:hypothetical protein